MFRRICNIASRACVLTTQNRSPSQIAWGIAFGLSFGLIPKDNLLSAMLLAGLLLFRVNHLAACLVFVATAPIQGWLAYFVHPAGQFILSQPGILNGLTAIYKIPGVAWLRLNNTLVMGGFATGMLTVVPVYTVARQVILRTQQRLSEIAVEQIANDATNYRKTVIEQTRQRSILVNAVPDETTLTQTALPPELKLGEARTETVATKLDATKAHVTKPHATKPNTTPGFTAEVASQIAKKESSIASTDIAMATSAATASEADSAVIATQQVASSGSSTLNDGVTTSDTFTAVQQPLTVSDTISIQTKNIKPKIFTKVDEVVTDGGETVLRETIIEVVRYKRPRIVAHSREATEPDSELTTQGEPMSIANAPQSETTFAGAVTTTTLEIHPSVSSTTTGTMNTGNISTGGTLATANNTDHSGESKPQLTIHPVRGEESLRYLLWHINGNRDTKKQSERTA